MEWMLMPYRRYADFSGRSRRKEYWMFTLFLILVTIVIYGLLIGGLSGGNPEEPGILFYLGAILVFVFWLGTLIPSIAVQVRRFHDLDKSGWFYLLNFIPFGGLIVLVMMCMEGTRGENNYGPDPKDPNQVEVFS